ncbi:MAG: hypothetical protein KJ063_02475 [Anaerolineae bacterium]|nr:hypothetical protein [Anaerolineae bacterium]
MTVQATLPGMPAEDQPILDHTHAAERGLFELALHSEGVEWHDAYGELVERGWYWRKAAVIAWLCLPKQERKPKTKQELATLLGLGNTGRIVEWERDPAVQAKILAVSQASLLHALADVDKALVTAASSSDYKNNQDRKTYYQRLGLLTDKHELAMSQNKAGEAMKQMSDAELLALAQAGEEDDPNYSELPF